MDLVEVEFSCPVCRQVRKTLATEEKFEEITNRTCNIQDILNPKCFSATYREIFISNICSTCQLPSDEDEPVCDVAKNESTNSILNTISKMYENERK